MAKVFDYLVLHGGILSVLLTFVDAFIRSMLEDGRISLFKQFFSMLSLIFRCTCLYHARVFVRKNSLW